MTGGARRAGQDPLSESVEETDERAANVLRREAETFACATQLPCRAIDSVGDCVDGGSMASVCRLCALTGSPEGSAEQVCASVLRDGMRQAERFGGAYMSFCPHSLLITVAVVRKEAIAIGALVLGPLLLVDRQELIAEELTDGAGGEIDHGAVTDILDTMPSLDTRRAKALADMLEVAAQRAGDELEGRFDPKVESAKRNARIAEYIQYLKSQGFDTSSDGDALIDYPFEKEQVLIHYVATGHRAGARRVLNEILGNVFFAGGGEIQGVRTRALELVVLLSRAAVEGGATAQEVFGTTEDFIRHIYVSRTIEDISSWLALVLNRFIDLVFAFRPAKHEETIRRAERFIKEHYGEELSLDAVADEVGLSKSYFSTIFKEETGKGFAPFLNEIRIARAKDMLRNYAAPVSEISSMVGFVDQSYFSKVFKAIVGISPAAYREGAFSPESHIEIHESRP